MESIKFPVGRIVSGSLYRLNDRNMDGELLTYKTGAKIGQQRYSVFFAIAIKKNPGETHFSQTEWGKKLWAIGHAAHPTAAQSRDYAWKVVDGDSTEKNTEGVSPSQREGWAGHWIVKFNNSEIPRIGQWLNGKYEDLMQADFVKPGYFIEVVADVEGNGTAKTPGLYLNHKLVCFRAYGPEIVFGPDPDKAGFGEGALPEGASSVPLAAPPAPAIPAIPAVAPAIPAVAPAIPAATPAIPAAAPAAAPAIPAATPAAAPAKVMTPKAAGATYESMIAAGWTDAQMIEQGYLQAPVTPIPNFGNLTGIPSVAPVAPVKLMTAKAAGATYDQFVAAGYTDAQMIEQGYLVG